MGLALVSCQQQAPAPSSVPPTTTAPNPSAVTVQPATPVAPPAMPMVQGGIAGTPDANSARQALRTWLDCFIKGDGGTFYDMLPGSSKTRLDQWFAQLSTNPKWKADPESAKVPTTRHFMILSFEEAKKQGNMMTPITDADFGKIANTCSMNGNVATFINKKGEKMIFTLEAGTWRMDVKIADSMVDGIIKSVNL